MIVHIELVLHMGGSKRSLVMCAPNERGCTLEIVWTTEPKILMGWRHEFMLSNWSTTDWYVFMPLDTLFMLPGIFFICDTSFCATLRLLTKFLTSSVGGTCGQMRPVTLDPILFLFLTWKGSGIESCTSEACCAGDEAVLVMVFVTILSRSSCHWWSQIRSVLNTRWHTRCLTCWTSGGGAIVDISTAGMETHTTGVASRLVVMLAFDDLSFVSPQRSEHNAR